MVQFPVFIFFEIGVCLGYRHKRKGLGVETKNKVIVTSPLKLLSRLGVLLDVVSLRISTYR